MFLVINMECSPCPSVRGTRRSDYYPRHQVGPRGTWLDTGSCVRLGDVPVHPVQPCRVGGAVSPVPNGMCRDNDDAMLSAPTLTKYVYVCVVVVRRAWQISSDLVDEDMYLARRKRSLSASLIAVVYFFSKFSQSLAPMLGYVQRGAQSDGREAFTHPCGWCGWWTGMGGSRAQVGRQNHTTRTASPMGRDHSCQLGKPHQRTRWCGTCCSAW